MTSPNEEERTILSQALHEVIDAKLSKREMFMPKSLAGWLALVISLATIVGGMYYLAYRIGKGNEAIEKIEILDRKVETLEHEGAVLKVEHFNVMKHLNNPSLHTTEAAKQNQISNSLAPLKEDIQKVTLKLGVQGFQLDRIERALDKQNLN